MTNTGIEQVESNAFLLKTKLAASENGAICFYSSPLGRARQSAAIIKKELQMNEVEIRYDKNLQEVDIGSWNGKSLRDVQQTGVKMDNFNWYFHSDGGESYEEVVQRCQSWIEAAEQLQENTIIVMSHGLFGRVLRACLLELPYEEAIYLDVPQKGFFEVHNQQLSFVRDDFEEF